MAGSWSLDFDEKDYNIFGLNGCTFDRKWIYIYIYICIYIYIYIICILYYYIYCIYTYILHIIYYYFYDNFRLYTSNRYNAEHYWTLPCFPAKTTGAATGSLLQKKLFIKKLHQFQRKAHVLEPHFNSLILKLQVGGPGL